MKPNGLRLKFYSNETTDDGQVVSCVADQYGRVMEEYYDKKGKKDIRPTGQCIYVNH